MDKNFRQGYFIECFHFTLTDSKAVLFDKNSLFYDGNI